jgi:two-component system invasion response regulator UvrY
MSGKPAILIVDPDRFRRLGISEILTRRWPDAILEHADSYGTAINLLDKTSWDLALVDLNLPGWRGLDFISDATSKWKTPALAMSSEPEDLYGLRAMRCGSAGYFRRGQHIGALVLAVSAVLEGRHYLTGEMAELLAQRLSPGAEKKSHSLAILSDRELQVLRALAEGQQSKEVAMNLSLSSKTVGTYKSRILEKLRIKNDGELVMYCLNIGLIS